MVIPKGEDDGRDITNEQAEIEYTQIESRAQSGKTCRMIWGGTMEGKRVCKEEERRDGRQSER